VSDTPAWPISLCLATFRVHERAQLRGEHPVGVGDQEIDRLRLTRHALGPGRWYSSTIRCTAAGQLGDRHVGSSGVTSPCNTWKTAWRWLRVQLPELAHHATVDVLDPLRPEPQEVAGLDLRRLDPQPALLEQRHHLARSRRVLGVADLVERLLAGRPVLTGGCLVAHRPRVRLPDQMVLQALAGVVEGRVALFGLQSRPCCRMLDVPTAPDTDVANADALAKESCMTTAILEALQ
jgi:hypothetical protein